MSSTINARASARKTYALITTETRPSFKVPFEYNRQVSIDNPVKMPLEREGSKVHELENGTQDEDQQAKRRRTEAGKFAAGSILRVTLTNFVTYTSAEFFPGPNMNLVIGPNGSGKSTIVCAICLGLGYSPNVLGRATAVSDFVQHGADGAEIEIELALPENKSMIIKRKIKKDKNTSQFFVNGKPATLAVVQEHMKTFNIQIDNLCQFLPQDRVASFAQLTPIQLLHETQRAVGGEIMVEHWERLCKLRAEARELETSVTNDAASLTNLNQKQNTARIQVERLQRRNEIIARIESLKVRIPVAKYTAAKEVHTQLKLQRKELHKKAEELRETIDPLRKRSDQYGLRKDQFLRQQETSAKTLDRLKKKIKEYEDNTSAFEDTASTLRRQKTAIKKASQEKRRSLEKLREDVRKLEFAMNECQKKQDRRDLAHEEELKNTVKALATEKREKSREVNNVNHNNGQLVTQRNDLVEQERKLNNDLRTLLSVESRRLQSLRSYQRTEDVIKVINWLRDGGDKRFDQEVFLPPVLTVGVTDPSVAGIVESFFAQPERTTFTCQSSKDYDTFTRLILDGKDDSPFPKGLNVSAVSIDCSKSFEPPCSNEKLRSLGFDYWFKDVLTGPEPVIKMLCNDKKIHQMAVSKRPINQQQMKAIENAVVQSGEGPRNIITSFIGALTRFELNRSKYGAKELSNRSSTIHPKSDFFTNNVDENVKKALEEKIRKLKSEVDALNVEINTQSTEERALRARLTDIDTEKTNIAEQLKVATDIETEVERSRLRHQQKKESLETEEATPDNSEEKLAELERQEQANIAERVEFALQWESYIKEAVVAADALLALKIKCIQAEADAANAMAEAGQHSTEYDEALQRLAQIDDDTSRAKVHANQLIAEARRIAAEMGDNFTDMANDAMNQTESVAELEAHLEEEQNTLRANQQQNTVGVLEAYEKRAKDIAEIEERMANRQGLIDGTNREIAEKRQIWEPRLERLVRRVSAAFADAFESIGCAGEVLLSKSGEEGKPDTDDFEKWQLHIKVKFRQQEKLQQLTGQRQSGGERSVSTIFFLMALQEMARAPFRVVDEINQGMDPKNERLVHKRMVEAACRDGTSQYFLITPKLLPGLDYHRKMKVLTVNNGKFVPQSLDLGTIIQRARELQAV